MTFDEGTDRGHFGVDRFEPREKLAPLCRRRDVAIDGRDRVRIIRKLREFDLQSIELLTKLSGLGMRVERVEFPSKRIASRHAVSPCE